ncbi:MAG: DUF559 domain-containing protein [Solirubrobacteraceae bacterium]
MRHVLDTRAPDLEIAALAAAQHGVVSLAQLRRAGLAIGAVNARVRAGRLHRLHTGVFAVGHTRLSREGRWLAAVLALGDGAALSHVSGAALWGLRPSSATRTHVTVPTSAGRPHRDAIRVHRSRTLTPADVTTHDAIPVTTVARTLLDLAGVLATGPLERAIERALQLRLFDLTALRDVLYANPNARGARTLRRLLGTIANEPPLTRSHLEALMRDLCDAHAIERPAVNALVDGREVDFLWRRERLVVETDGHETHGTRTAFEADRARDARLTVLGYRVVRFTHRRLTREPHDVASTLTALLV